MKGQAAMEYLMTYGWAILVVIAVVAALYMMGVFRLGAATAVPCSPCFSYFAYIDYSGTANALVIRNGARRITISSVTSGVGNLDIGFSMGANNAVGTEVVSGQTLYINTQPLPSGRNSIRITYTDLDSGLTHIDEATLNK